MRYWLKKGDNLVGPLESRELLNVPSISLTSIACLEPELEKKRRESVPLKNRLAAALARISRLEDELKSKASQIERELTARHGEETKNLELRVKDAQRGVELLKSELSLCREAE